MNNPPASARARENNVDTVLREACDRDWHGGMAVYFDRGTDNGPHVTRLPGVHRGPRFRKKSG